VSAPPGSLEGWEPAPRDADELERIIDYAFDYRGDVTVVMKDGSQHAGYVFNRDRDLSEPFLQMIESATSARVRLGYADIRTIRFTGRDMAAGKSYAAWLERKAAATRTGTTSAPGA
jgi:hypothetical protein